jgi:hypothetical protein
MPCPNFLPAAHSGNDAAAGSCAGDPAATIPSSRLRSCCERGYARALCQIATALEADATALLIKADHDGTVEVAWSLERDHHPVAVGTIAIQDLPVRGTPIELQASALVRSYLRKLGRL